MPGVPADAVGGRENPTSYTHHLEDRLDHDKYVSDGQEDHTKGGPQNTPAAKSIPTGCPENMLIDSLINTMTKYYKLAGIAEHP